MKECFICTNATDEQIPCENKKCGKKICVNCINNMNKLTPKGYFCPFCRYSPKLTVSEDYENLVQSIINVSDVNNFDLLNRIINVEDLPINIYFTYMKNATNSPYSLEYPIFETYNNAKSWILFHYHEESILETFEKLSLELNKRIRNNLRGTTLNI